MNPTLTDTLAAMEQYGGSFVKQYAKTLRMADPVNRAKLVKALPDIIKHYSSVAKQTKLNSELPTDTTPNATSI